MFDKPSLALRIGIGKGIGFVVGLLGFIFLPDFYPQADWFLRWGILLWYTTLGAIIGIFGVYERHPVLMFPMPWWFRAPFLGGWMNFILTFFAYDVMKAVLVSTMGADSAFTSPFWFVAEGAVFGLLVGYFATRYGGEGPETAGR